MSDIEDILERSSDEEPNEEDLMFIAPDEEVEIEVQTAEMVSRQLDDLQCDINIVELQELGPILDSKRESKTVSTYYDENQDEIRNILLEGDPYVDDDGYSVDCPDEQDNLSDEWVPSSEDEFE